MSDLDIEIDRHYAALAHVNADESMNPDGPYATISNPEYFSKGPHGDVIPTLARRKLHQQWIDEIIAASPNLETDRQAVVMAGPPGAGKGYVQREHLGDLPGYVVCDPDIFKEKILRHELATDQLKHLETPLIKDLKKQGERFAPMEYASLVHEESSLLSAKLQAHLRRTGSNFVIDTVLKSEASAEKIKNQLDRDGYEYKVISVQTTQEVSQQSVLARWKEPYREFLNGTNELGGRCVPAEFVASVFPTPGEPSYPEKAARWLAENGRGCTEYRLYRRQEAAPHRLEIDQTVMNGKLVDRADSERHQRRASSFPTLRRETTPNNLEIKRTQMGAKKPGLER